MKHILLFLFIMPQLSLSQTQVVEGATHLTLIGNSNICKKSFSAGLISIDANQQWENFDTEDIAFFTERFSHFKKLLETQISQPEIFSGCECVQYSTTMGGINENLPQKAVEVYEVTFKHTTQVERVLNKINKAKIETVDWPDASIPVRFYVKEKSLFVFLDASDDHYEKEATVWFNELVSRLMKKLDDL